MVGFEPTLSCFLDILTFARYPERQLPLPIGLHGLTNLSIALFGKYVNL